ncbi:MAG: leucine-rich repeat domain-containing protein [Dolichospermum sp.]
MTKLNVVYLEKNQIQNIESLSALENLRTLKIENNPLISKQCPLRPRSICKF